MDEMERDLKEIDEEELYSSPFFPFPRKLTYKYLLCTYSV